MIYVEQLKNGIAIFLPAHSRSHLDNIKFHTGEQASCNLLTKEECADLKRRLEEVLKST